VLRGVCIHGAREAAGSIRALAAALSVSTRISVADLIVVERSSQPWFRYGNQIQRAGRILDFRDGKVGRMPNRLGYRFQHD
jgi:hypothetical protein